MIEIEISEKKNFLLTFPFYCVYIFALFRSLFLTGKGKPMKIIIMRHGEAEIFAHSDESRPLTNYGKQSSFKQGTKLKSTALSAQSSFDKVLVSPYLRAKQTFEQVNTAFNQELASSVEIWDAITPYGNAELVVSYLETLNEIENLLIISHLPLVGELISELCGRNGVTFLPATYAEIEWDGQKGKLISSEKP